MTPLKDTIILPTFMDAKGILDKSGILILSDIISEHYLKKCQEYVDVNISDKGNRYFTISDVTRRVGSPFAELSNSDALKDFVDALVSLTNIPQVENDMSQGENLRVIAGEQTASQAMKFHFDSSILTMLMPIRIPDGSPAKSGDLIAFPNIRSFTTSIIPNLFWKAWYQNPVARKVMSKRAASGKYASYTVKLVPGSLYFFWGFRTLHANFSCEANRVRATTLFFFGNPPPSDPVMKIVKRRRDGLESRILNGQVT